ncbi:polyadenylate-binding protein 1-A-like [Silurus meridionalis]|uniref:polyadenylate-binding protein 1-A-like n=1 Tax=Silurus meridionalis TaxID=175797 RepID=UPI001EEC0E3D|nr:polyadenylate-binding protein 1-A-like [Silurus meridionalis]
MKDVYEAFLRFGTVLTAHVMMENRRSKDIGCVTFSSPDEARVDIMEMNGRVLGSRTVYLSPSQSLSECRNHLTFKTLPRPKTQRQQEHPSTEWYCTIDGPKALDLSDIPLWMKTLMPSES